MKLSVVILNYNVRYFLELCIKSVQASLDTISSEIIVIDNNSSDESCAMVKRIFPEVVLIENKENVGFAVANNQAVKKAKGQYVCILNPDTVVAEDTFENLLIFYENNDKVGIVGCKLIDGTGSFLPESKRNIPTPLVSLKKILGFEASYYANHLTEDEVGKASVFVGAFMFLEKSIYEELNGFDEQFFMYGEDIDFSYRALQLGCDNYYYGKTTCIHFKGECTIKDKTYANRFYGAMNIFYKKHFKRNLILDILIKIGITLIPLLKSNKRKMIPKRSKLLSANDLSYKQIINSLENKTDYYKIQPRNSNFTIASDGSESQGIVDLLD